MLDKDTKNWAAAVHLAALAGFVFPLGNILGPLIIWLIKKDSSDFINQSGKSALNFQISLTIYSIIGFLFLFMSFFATIEQGGAFLMFPMIAGFILLSIIEILFIVFAAVSTDNGKVFRYPLSIRFLR